MKCLSLRQQLCPWVFYQLVILLCAVSFLSACVTVEKHPLPPGSEIGIQAAWETHRANIEAINIWNLKGRVAGKSNNEGFSSGVQWKQLENNFVIDLFGPLGRKVAVITSQQGSVQLKTSKGESFVAKDPEELMQRLFDYSLPVNGLRYWLLGIPDPKQSHALLDLDKYGRLKHLKQAGWLIDYNDYHGGNPILPALIHISNPTLNANIKIDLWQLGTEK
jgi:outer membrane lipoprotein LolB